MILLRFSPSQQMMHVLQNRVSEYSTHPMDCRLFQGRRLATMGVPSSSGHYLYPEEAVYLMEICLASVSIADESDRGRSRGL